MKKLRIIYSMFVIAALLCPGGWVGAQSISGTAADTSVHTPIDIAANAGAADSVVPPVPDVSFTATTTRIQPGLTYRRPTEKTKLANYLMDSFGPYAIGGAGLFAGLDQIGDTPPEWGQGLNGYGKRFGSNFAVGVATTTTRYALAEIFREDTLYYRCTCRGVFPRIGHAVTSTITARRGIDGHRQFSVPALIAPYAGTMTAVYGWYPSRYDARDALRMGNYTLLTIVAENIAREFLYGGPRTLFSHLHLAN